MNESLREHYRKLLGLDKPWEVVEIELAMEHKRVEIRLAHRKGVRVSCPECGEGCAIHDEAPERQWRHLDIMQFETLLRARVPRANCSECGVKTIAVAWAGKHSRFTLLFEAFAIEVLKASASISAACDLLRLNWPAADRIMNRAVERGLGRRTEEPVAKAGIDEKSFRKGHRYVSTLNDLASGRVIEVVEGRDEASAAKLFESLSPTQREGVEAIALDMWKAFINAAGKACKNADLVHDKFHISKHLGEAVNAVRKAEVKKLRAVGDTRLDGTRWWWLYSEENIKEEVWERFEALKDSELKTGRAWSIKECFRWFWEPHLSREEARDYFKQWYGWAIRSQLAPIKKVARMLKAHLEELLNWCDHHITNAVSEGLNSRIQSIKSAARGFHHFKSYRTRILFFCGKLDISPLEVSH